jgi:fumarate reductase flavoprotein subunit
MMGGVEFALDCTTEREGLYVAGEDSGGVHGANRLGGNGVANSTVFGGFAGTAMARALKASREHREPDADALRASVERRWSAVAAGGADVAVGGLEVIRERLFTTMWNDAGIVRDAPGLARAASVLADLGDALQRYRLPADARNAAFNLTWHDWLNLSNLVEVSKVIVRAAQSRENSRGAHFRADFPEPGDLATSRYTRARQAANGDIAVESVPVVFNRVRPGLSLV